MSGMYERDISDQIFGGKLSPTPHTYQNEATQFFNQYEFGKHCVGTHDIEQLVAQFKGINFDIDTWQNMSELAQSNDPQKRYEGTHKLRLMLSASGEIPIQTVLDTGVVPTLVSYLCVHTFPDLQFEAAWSLTNIASGTSLQTEYVVQHNAIPGFISMLSSPFEKLREQSIWGLGNIAGDRAQFRDLILNEINGLHMIIQAIESFSKLDSQQIGIWAISNLCRGYPRPEIHLVLPTIELLLNNLMLHTNHSILTDTCWALDGMVENPIGMKTFLSYTDSIKLVVPLLENTHTSVQRPALSIIAQIAASVSAPTTALIELGAIQGLLKLLQSNRRSVRKETCWALSNISLGSICQLPKLIEFGVFSSLLDVFLLDEEMEVKKEAAWAICTTYIAGSMHHVASLINLDYLKIFSNMLQINDTKVLTLVLDALMRIMKIGDQKMIEIGATHTFETTHTIDATHTHESTNTFNPCLQLFLQTDGPYQIFQLAHYPDFKVSSKVAQFIINYLSHLPETKCWGIL